jgi:hypothetical protein
LRNPLSRLHLKLDQHLAIASNYDSPRKMPRARELQRQPRPSRPSLVDDWNKSIALPVSFRPTTNDQKPRATTVAKPMAKPSDQKTSGIPALSPCQANDADANTTTTTTTTTVLSAAKALAKAPVKFAVGHPNFMRRYAFPLALNALSRPLLSLLPLGPLGPMVAFVAVACGRFKLRQEFMGGGYAVLHAVGAAGIKGQALSLLGLVGLEATGSRRLRDTFVNALVESNIGVRTQVVGLAIAVLSSVTGTFGSLGAMLGARSMSLLYKELRSFATFHGLKWAATHLQGLWLIFCASSDAVKASFLSHVLQQKGSDKRGKVDDKTRLQWAINTLQQVAARIPEFPVEAVAPELAAVLKAWDQEKESARASHEALDEWVDIDPNDRNSWDNISHDNHEDMAALTANIAAYVDRRTFEDFSHHRPSKENVDHLEQVAREVLETSGMDGEQVTDALNHMGLGSRRKAPWSMEVEELDSEVEEDDDGIEVVDLDDILER